jgi:hypothetical protein
MFSGDKKDLTATAEKSPSYADKTGQAPYSMANVKGNPVSQTIPNSFVRGGKMGN